MATFKVDVLSSLATFGPAGRPQEGVFTSPRGRHGQTSDFASLPILGQVQRCALAFALEDNLTAADIRLIQSDVFSKVPISKSICHQISVKLLKRHY